MAKTFFAWSYSTLSMFENCPRKFWAVKIAKVDDTNQWNAKGDTEHSAIEGYIKQGLHLPPHMGALSPLLDKVRALPGERYVEYKMALKQDLSVTHGRDWDNVWVRVNADFINVNGAKAIYLDWKSGKPRDSEDQITLTALSIFRHFPAVQQVNGGLVHYAHGKLASPTIVQRSDESRLWNGYITRARAIDEAVRDNNFPATPNPLCGWCPYRACPHNKTEEREAKERARNGG